MREATNMASGLSDGSENPYMATFATNALHYRGIGSGIVRILSEYPEIGINNDVNGKEFKVIIPRTIQKKDLIVASIAKRLNIDNYGHSKIYR